MFDFKVHFKGMPMFGCHAAALPQHGESDERQTHSLEAVTRPGPSKSHGEQATKKHDLYIAI